MRPLLSDGYNSAAHVAIGFVGFRLPIVAIAFVAYQLGQGGQNTLIDITEGAIGWGMNLLLMSQIRE